MKDIVEQPHSQDWVDPPNNSLYPIEKKMKPPKEIRLDKEKLKKWRQWRDEFYDEWEYWREEEIRHQ